MPLSFEFARIYALDLFRKSCFAEACGVATDYHEQHHLATLVSRRWELPAGPTPVATLQAIAHVYPRVLANVPLDALTPIRSKLAEAFLFRLSPGRNRETLALENTLFSAAFNTAMRDHLHASVGGIRVRVQHPGEPCPWAQPFCREDSALDDMPEIPHELCSNTDEGCCCLLSQAAAGPQ